MCVCVKVSSSVFWSLIGFSSGIICMSQWHNLRLPALGPHNSNSSQSLFSTYSVLSSHYSKLTTGVGYSPFPCLITLPNLYLHAWLPLNPSAASHRNAISLEKPHLIPRERFRSPWSRCLSHQPAFLSCMHHSLHDDFNHLFP